jgi:hypothetical protein
MVFNQNNFTLSNIMAVNEKMGVCDWSDAELHGIPMLDLVYGLSNLAFISEGAWDVQHKIRVYRSLLDQKTVLGNIFQTCLQRYSDALGMPYTKIASLRLATWILHSYFEVRRCMADQEPEEFSSQEEDLYISLLKLELQKH